MDEDHYRAITSGKAIVVREGFTGIPNKKQLLPSAPVDRSSQDWRMCMQFFESSPDETAQSALDKLSGKFLANRGANQAYYEKLTVENARRRVAVRLGGAKGDPTVRKVAPDKLLVNPAARLLTIQEVRQMIDGALRPQPGKLENVPRLCSLCEVSHTGVGKYSAKERAKPDGQQS